MKQVKTLTVCLLFCLICLLKISAQEVPSGASPAREIGGRSAKFKLEVFNDYQCPTCKVSEQEINKVIQKYPNDVFVIYRNFPLLSIHPNAMLAARAVEAAGEQGKFREMKNLIFQNQKDWAYHSDSEKIILSYASKLGLQIEKFKSDLTGSVVMDRINADIERGKYLKLNSTPTILLNGKVLSFPEFSNLEETLLSQENK